MKKHVLYIITLLCAISVVSCSKTDNIVYPEDNNVTVVGFLAEPTIMELNVGETCPITMKMLVLDGPSQDITSLCEYSIQEVGNDTEVISLEDNKVTALKKGSAGVQVMYRGMLVEIVLVRANK